MSASCLQEKVYAEAQKPHYSLPPLVPLGVNKSLKPETVLPWQTEDARKTVLIDGADLLDVSPHSPNKCTQQADDLTYLFSNHSAVPQGFLTRGAPTENKEIV